MAQTIGEIALRWAKRLKASEDLRGWCEEHLGTAAKVLYGIVLQDPPTEDDCPLIVVTPVRMELTEGENSAVVSLGWVITEDSRTDEDGVTVMEGLRLVEEFGREIWAELLKEEREASLVHFVEPVTFEVEGELFFPMFAGSMEVQVNFA